MKAQPLCDSCREWKGQVPITDEQTYTVSCEEHRLAVPGTLSEGVQCEVGRRLETATLFRGTSANPAGLAVHMLPWPDSELA